MLSKEQRDRLEWVAGAIEACATGQPEPGRGSLTRGVAVVDLRNRAQAIRWVLDPMDAAVALLRRGAATQDRTPVELSPTECRALLQALGREDVPPC